MSKKAEEQDLAERERIEREKAAEEAKKHRASKGEPATETEHPPSDKLEELRAKGELLTNPEKGPYHGYSKEQIKRMEAERDPPDAVPTEDSAAVPPNPEPEQPSTPDGPPPEPEPPPPEPPARGRAA